jgi:hypothetical protein
MSAHNLHSAALATLIILGAMAAVPAGAADPLPAKGLLGKAQSLAERDSLEALMKKLEAARRQSSPRPATLDEAAKAEELARELQLERSKPAGTPGVREAASPSNPAVSFAFPKSTGGQPVGRTLPPEPEPEPAPAPAEPAPVHQAPTALPPMPPTPTPPVQPEISPLRPVETALPPVAPGIHLSPASRPVAAAPTIEPDPPAPQPRSPIPELPRLAAPVSDKDPAPAASKRGHPATASRRGMCTDILQRATLGELTEEDRAILRTQCR